MNQRQRKKAGRKFCREFAMQEGWFIVPKKRRYGEVVASLERQLDDAMEYYYGRLYR